MCQESKKLVGKKTKSVCACVCVLPSLLWAVATTQGKAYCPLRLYPCPVGKIWWLVLLKQGGMFLGMLPGCVRDCVCQPSGLSVSDR